MQTRLPIVTEEPDNPKSFPDSVMVIGSLSEFSASVGQFRVDLSSVLSEQPWT
jgi:hypothetical protein